MAEGITQRDLQTTAAQFGANEGLDLILSLLDTYGLRATVAVPAVIAEIYPARIKSLAEAGHEIAALGLKHEDVSALSRDEEKARLEVTTDILTQLTGERPSGWFSLPRQGDPFAVGTVSTNTMDLLIEAGYSYMGNGLADDIPHYWVSDFASKRAILTLPYYYHFDDQYFCLFPRQGSGLEHPDMLARNWRAEFAAQYRRGRHFTMTLHPNHSGWCNRLEVLEAFLAHMTSFPDLWNATGQACAEYWLKAYPAEQYLKLEPSIWQDYPGSLS
jgi:peptidoglycan/xylan/chitin deacetylase (PgdA/CDA1 family)